MEINEQEKINILLSLLNERYHASHQMRSARSRRPYFLFQEGGGFALRQH